MFYISDSLLCVCRSPSENPNYFLQHLQKNTETYIPTVSLVICGDLNYLRESSVKQNLEPVMKTFNLTQVVTFPTRICVIINEN